MSSSGLTLPRRRQLPDRRPGGPAQSSRKEECLQKSINLGRSAQHPLKGSQRAGAVTKLMPNTFLHMPTTIKLVSRSDTREDDLGGGRCPLLQPWVEQDRIKASVSQARRVECLAGRPAKGSGRAYSFHGSKGQAVSHAHPRSDCSHP